jgi:peptide/nickel transport system substrate-binding protein
MKGKSKALAVALLICVALGAWASGDPEGGGAAEPATIRNPDTFIYASYGSVDSLDPAKAYDNASGGVIQNIYEPLVDFKGSSTEEFVPVLAEEVPTAANGLISQDGLTYRFKIRKGVTFHSGNPLRPEDVEYSFERSMVVDPSGGPVSLFAYPLLGVYRTRDGDGNIVVDFEDIDRAVEVDGDYVVFHLKQAFAPFLGILTGYWAGIVDKEFVIENGGWDGTEATWESYNGPAEGAETLYEITSGTGPYMLDRWEKGVEVVMARNPEYWGEAPAMAKAIYRVVEEWTTRKLMLLQGDVDAAQVDTLYYGELDQEEGLKASRANTLLSVSGINFNQAVDTTDNPYIGSGRLDGEGIPGDFFADPDVRRAFMYCWDQETFENDVLLGSGISVPTPLVSGLPFFNPDLEGIPLDLGQAEELFRTARGGEIWDQGFEFDVLYNSGNEVRETALKILAENVMSLNPKFTVNVRAIEWAVILDLQRQRRLPIFYMGWGADYPDPDSFMQPYMHSQGHWALYGSYSNPEADRLVEEGAVEVDPDRRRDIYYRLQDIWLEDAVGIILYQSVENFYFRDWVEGFVFHPMQNEYKYSMFDKR